MGKAFNKLIGKVSYANRIFALLLALSMGMFSFLLLSVKTENEFQAYSIHPSVDLNKNVPGFTAYEITTKSCNRCNP